MIGGIGYDQVVLFIWMGDQPPAAVIDKNMRFRIRKQRANDWIFSDEFEVPRIDFNDVHTLDARVMDQRLCPGPRGEPNNQNSLRRGMNSG